MTLVARTGAEMGLDALSLETIEAMKRDLNEVIAHDLSTPARKSDARALLGAIDASIDRTLGWVEAVREAMDRKANECVDHGPSCPSTEEFYASEQDGDIYRDYGGEA